MRSMVVLLILIFIVSLITACDSEIDHLEPSPSGELFIQSNVTCGWCAGTSFFAVTQGRATFSHDYACDDEQFEDIPTQKIVIDSQDWQELMVLFDFEALRAIDLQSCARCADGCDTEITLVQNDEEHSFSYAYLQENDELASVNEFLSKLEEIRSGYASIYY